MTQIMAHVLMVEDDSGRRRTFCEYAETRGDIGAHVTGYASDIWAIIKNSLEKNAPIDLFLLDIRLPNLPRDRVVPPDQRHPHGARFARELSENPDISSTPVVVYTQYAASPVIANELNYLQQNCANVVALHRTRPPVDETLYSGLACVNNLGLTIQQDHDNKGKITVSVGAQVSCKHLRKGRILLNGHTPQGIYRVSSGQGLLLLFDHALFYQDDYNYLMVQSRDGRKAFFSVQ